MPSRNKISIGAKVDVEVANQLKQIAQRENKSMGDLVRERVIEDYESLSVLSEWGGITVKELGRQLLEMYMNGQLEIADGKVGIK